jgi:acetylornithine deacetylase/succinyl-diaminopimelate desuccinylase-like protein
MQMTTLYKSLLSEFIKFKSISTDVTFATEIQKTVYWLKNTFTEHQFQVEIINNYGNPIVIAKYIADPSFQTCLIYGHYDVQPATQEEGWNSDPFTLTEKNGRIYARGAIDNKGQVMIHIATVFELIKDNNLAYNITFMIEGNEETGSPLMEKFVNDHKDKLLSDFVVISDGEITDGNPVIELGFRGGFNVTLTLQTATVDLHSGIYGGIAPNSAHEAAKFISTLYDTENKIKVDGFYDNVLPINETSTIPFNKDTYTQITGAKSILKEDNIDPYSQVGLRPTIQVTGVQTGYVGEGYRNSIPAKTVVKINFRLVKNQNPDQILELFKNHVKKALPAYVTYSIENSDPYDGIKLDVDNSYIQKAVELLEQTFNKTPLKKYSGGGLPIVTLLDQVLKVPQVLVPLANEDCNMHGANENYTIQNISMSLEWSKKFLGKNI